MAFWDKMFSKTKKNKMETTNSQSKILTIENNRSGRTPINLYDNYQVRKSVNFIGGLIGSTELRQTYKNSKTNLTEEVRDKTMFLLNHKFSKNLTSFKAFKQMVARMLIYQDSFAWLRRNELGVVQEIIPLLTTSYQLIVTEQFPDYYFVKFSFKDGTTKVLPYEDLIHFTYDFMEQQLFGDNNKPLIEVAEINSDLWASLITWNKDNTVIKGFLKANTILKKEDMQVIQNDFSTMLKSEQNSYMVMDGKFEYVPVSEKNTPMDVAYITKIENTMNKYFGISEKIMDGTASKEELETFHKMYMKPLYCMIEQELESKLLNDKAMSGYDRKIRFVTSQFDHMTNSEKTSALTLMSNLGAITINEIRSEYGLPRVEAGDVFIYSKNFAEVGQTDETTSKEVDKDKPKDKPIKEEEEEIDAKDE